MDTHTHVHIEVIEAEFEVLPPQPRPINERAIGLANMLSEALAHGRAEILPGIRRRDRKPVTLLCVITAQGQGIKVVRPVAEIIEEDPISAYKL